MNARYDSHKSASNIAVVQQCVGLARAATSRYHAVSNFTRSVTIARSSNHFETWGTHRHLAKVGNYCEVSRGVPRVSSPCLVDNCTNVPPRNGFTVSSPIRYLHAPNKGESAQALDKRPASAKTHAAMPEKRSFPPIVASGVRLLILGSLPGDRSLAAQRYYAHPQNQFWRLMSGVIGRDLPELDYEARLAALLEAHVGLWDVVASASREGSSDAAIRDPIGNDLAGLVRTLPDLRAIGFNGATAFRNGSKQLAGVADIALIALPSSSPLHTVGAAAKQSAWDALRAYLA